ncbi:MAG: hypothetical protein KKD73_07230 [Proteobacteria bacterium]|nr:hypothetical protein [Pseudomonadota bacterium]MBU1640232.1 hypothetical protein [Pseudomonadota bacterium]
MKQFNVQDIPAALKKGFYLMRSDPELALQIRQLALTILIGIALAYGAYALLVGPRQKIIAKKQTQIIEIQNKSTAGQTDILASHLQKLGQDIKNKDHTLAVLTLQEELLREQWHKQGNDDRFHQVIFTLATSAPVDMQQDLLKMSQKEPRALEGFTLYPVHLEGKSYFENIFYYLSFLETSPEIGFLDKIELTVHSDDPTEKAQVDFKVDLGRLEVTNVL